MQTLSELLEVWQPEIDALAKGEGVDRLSKTLDPRRLLVAESERASEVDDELFPYARSLIFPSNSSIDDEVLYLVWTRIQEGCYYGCHLASRGLGEEKKSARDWVLFLTIYSWHEVLRFKWHICFRRHHGL